LDQTIATAQRRKWAFVAQDLGFAYSDGENKFVALEGLEFSIEQGEFLAITGASGSGKSTLMNLLGLLAKPTSGKLSIADGEAAPIQIEDLSPEEMAALRNRKIGFVFQQFHLLPRLTVWENVLLPVHYMQPPPDMQALRELRLRAKECLQKLGVLEQKDKFPASLSGGQKQRVAIARALLCNPDILLADEPTGALDSATSEEVLRIFSDLHREGRTVIVITHDPEVMRVAHRNLILRDGKIHADELVANRKDLGSESPVASPGLSPAAISPERGLPAIWRATKERLHNAVQPLTSVFQSLLSSKLRTLLTSLGLIIGVSSIIIMITLGQAAQDVILKIFHQAGTDRIYLGLDHMQVRTGKYAGYWEGLDIRRDIPAIQAVFADYAEIVPLAGWMTERVACAGGHTFDARLQGVSSLTDLLDRGAEMEKGRFFAPLEFTEGAKVAIVGSDFVDKLFPREYEGRSGNPNFPLGERLFTKGRLYATLTIVGVLKKQDSAFGNRDANEQFYLPINTYSQSTGTTNFTWISAKPRNGVSQRWLADSLKNYVTLMTEQKYPFRAEVPEETIAKIMMFIAVFQGLTTLIGGLCIVVGGIGIMNIMLVTIAERVREIGLRMAIGARPKDITWQFLMECIILCLLSGLVGLVVGVIFCNLVGAIAHMALPDRVPSQFLWSNSAVILGMTTAIVCGLLFGMMPALKAARLDPSEALRRE
jgi:macrolide transport system ATP-binding/permease protein